MAFYAPRLHLQVGAEEGLLLGVLEVVPHQQVQQDGRLGPQGRQLGDAALEHLAAESLAERHPALEQHRRELEGQRVSGLKVPSGWGRRLDGTFSTGGGGDEQEGESQTTD